MFIYETVRDAFLDYEMSKDFEDWFFDICDEHGGNCAFMCYSL